MTNFRRILENLEAKKGLKMWICHLIAHENQAKYQHSTTPAYPLAAVGFTPTFECIPDIHSLKALNVPSYSLSPPGPFAPSSQLQVQGPCLTWSWCSMWSLHNRILWVLISCWLSWCVYKLDGNTKDFVYSCVKCISQPADACYFQRGLQLIACYCICFPKLKPESHFRLDDSELRQRWNWLAWFTLHTMHWILFWRCLAGNQTSPSWPAGAALSIAGVHTCNFQQCIYLR